MRAPTRLTAYTLALAVAFALALGAGRLVGPHLPAAIAPASDGTASTDQTQDGPAHDDQTHDDHPTAQDRPVPAVPDGSDTLGGLRVVQAGYQLVPLATDPLAPGTPGELAFRILGPDGQPVTAYTPTHERDLHLIVVRRDLTGFQHLHPRRDADGTWRQRLALPDAGQYRLFTEFQPVGTDHSITLGVDLPVAGDYQPVPVPEPVRQVDVDGYQVSVTGTLRPGAGTMLTAMVTRDGAPVTDLQPYLGAYGHLVALRAGDLAYLHIHPEPLPDDPDTAEQDGRLGFHVEVPSAGTYRLFLEFQHAGQVHAAAFTMLAENDPDGPADD
ncbi:hypothetical protein O7632_10595 [Solwaraspora sp. WMMD406]|uniref:hypothetical protein n=1 Tax=Solwaraspora sp. WMMD406 TaxID=3016095 RepID=UPI0024167179|nr:hypothetical protein [Solwaraspora sp. WMMD406]MDG4764550.1 hypothetical protein [Solwaraspora sp. WMMD406]